MRCRVKLAFGFCIGFAAFAACAQDAADANSLKLLPNELPKAQLWETYSFELRASGGTEPYHWRVAEGSLPPDVFLSDDGSITAKLADPGPFEFTLAVKDDGQPPKEQKQRYELRAEAPLSAHWKEKAHVDGQRIDGSVTVSNHTGRDFDLTFVVLAVNDIGRATAIGYQHIPLQRDTKDLELSFGDTLSPGNYAVNVDVVGEEPISNRIFRSRLLSGKESVTQGP